MNKLRLKTLFQFSLERFFQSAIFCFLVSGCAPQINNKANLERIYAAKYGDTSPPAILQFDAPYPAAIGGTEINIPILASDERSSLGSYKLQYSENGIDFTDVSEALPEAASITWKVPKVDLPQVYLKLLASDSLGNTASETSKPFAIDSTPPAAPKLSLTSLASTNQSEATFTIADCKDTDSILINNGETPLLSDSLWQKCSTTTSAITYTFTQDGSFSLYAWARDIAGNLSQSPSAKVQITYDGTPPVISLVSVQTGLTIDITLSETIALGGTTATNYSISGSGKGTLSTNPDSVSLVSGNKYRLTWASGEMKNAGDITISATSAQDTFGNVIHSSATHVGGGIGTAPAIPSGLTLVTPASSPGNNTTPVIQVSGVSSGDTIGLFTDSTCFTSKASGVASGATINLTSSALTQATYTFYAQAIDAAGNASSCSTANVVYVLDTTAPTLAITTPSASSYVNNAGSASVTVSGSCSENGRTVSVSASDTGATSVSTTPICNTGATPNWTASLNFTTLADGAITIAASQSDAAGNTTNAASIVVTKDTSFPTLTITTPAASSYINNSVKASVTVSGSCSENGRTVSVSATDSGSTALSATPTCNTGSSPNWTTTFNFTSLVDGTVTLAASYSDAAGNTVSATNVNITRDVTLPALTLNSLTGGQYIQGGAAYAIGWTASDTNFGATPIKIEISSNSGSSWTVETAGTANSGSYNWNVPGSTNSNTYRIRMTATDLAGNVTVSTSSSDFTIDSDAPTVSALTITEGASTSNNNIRINMSASDPYTNVTNFCLKYNVSTTPSLADTCWVAVNAPSPGITPSTNVTFSNYYYRIGFTGGAYTVYGWVRDQAGNISSLSSSGSGTTGTDMGVISYTPGSPPTVINVLAVSSDTPLSPVSSADLTITAGSSVYIKWTATDDQALPATAISIYYTTDDSTYTLITSGLSNTAGAGCTAGAPYTGCYVWTNGAPTSTYFKIRVVAQDASTMTSFATGPSINSGAIRFLAGNTEPGLNASATSAVFISDATGNADVGSLVVAPDGTLYFRDVKRGIMVVSPSDGIQRLLIPTTGTASGDGGPISSATLRLPTRIAMDYQNRILIFDYDRIRRIDTTVSPMTINTIIGGGASTADGVAPLTVKITALSTYTGTGNPAYYMPFLALPNGDIYFQSDNYAGTTPAAGSRIRVYKNSLNQVQSIPTFSGTGDGINGSQDLTLCGAYSYNIKFDPTTSTVTSILASFLHTPNNASCTNAYQAFGQVAFDPTTGIKTANTTGYLSYYPPITGKDGEIYTVARSIGRVYKYDSTTYSWSIILGNGTQGTCADGTAALSCSNTVTDVFVNSQGQLYFVDRGQIRTIDGSGNVLTLAGQTLAFGDSGDPLSARFNMISAIQKRNSGEIIAFDPNELRFREFTDGGTIQTIAGNGSSGTPDTISLANAQPINSGNYNWQLFSANPSSGDLFYRRASNTIAKLDRTTGKWVDIAGGGATLYPSADGLTGTNINLSNGSLPAVLGFDGTHVLAAPFGLQAGTTWVDSFLKLYDISTGTQSQLAGATGNALNTPVLCADGTSLSSCMLTNPYLLYLTPVYDSTGTRWLILYQGSNVIRTMSSGGVIGTLTTLTYNAKAFTYIRTGSSPAELVYYCSASDSKIHKFDLTTDTALTWPISSMACTGKTMLFDSSDNSLIFIYVQNGMYGIAKYLNP